MKELIRHIQDKTIGENRGELTLFHLNPDEPNRSRLQLSSESEVTNLLDLLKKHDIDFKHTVHSDRFHYVSVPINKTKKNMRLFSGLRPILRKLKEFAVARARKREGEYRAAVSQEE